MAGVSARERTLLAFNGGSSSLKFAVFTATGDELVQHCRGQLAKFKVPNAVTFLDALPRNPSGKVLKRELRRAG